MTAISTLSSLLSTTHTGQRINRWIALNTLKELLPLLGSTSVVSFTFDDARASACTLGASILEEHQVRGTFYIAGGLTGQHEEGLPCHTEPMLRKLLADGHEIGCHSYSHRHYDRLDSAALMQEVAQNQVFLQKIGVPAGRLNFAYPFGAFSPSTKQYCAQHFRSSRITGGGAHFGHADLQALKTYRLYNDTTAAMNHLSFEHIVEALTQQAGWLIVNTHDIGSADHRYGYTPERLQAAIELVLSAGCKIMTVSDAIDHWQAQVDHVSA